MSETRVLPADVYDALEFVAEAFGGIGAGRYAESGFSFELVRGTDAPFCVWGCAGLLDASVEWDGEVADALTRACINTQDNDIAVGNINRRRGDYSDTRVPFDDWCAELGVVRGES